MSNISLDELIQSMTELKSKLPSSGPMTIRVWISDEFQVVYTRWKNNCKRFLARNYESDISYEDFKTAIENLEKYPSQNKFQEVIGVLEGYRTFPEIIKTNTISSNENSNRNKLNINIHNQNNNSQQQSQEQQLTFDLFISAIDDELTGKQRKELKAYLEETKDQPEEERKKGIVEKLKSFGTDLTLNILTNIITNPAIWGAL